MSATESPNQTAGAAAGGHPLAHANPRRASRACFRDARPPGGHLPAADSELTGATLHDVSDVRGGPPATASDLVGSTPRGAARRVSLAVRHCLERLDIAEGPLVIATSGGPDSLALAVAAIDVGSRWGMEVHTVTVDHGLRPESATEAAEVAKWCGRLGAQAHVVRVQVGCVGGPEGAARQARRDALIQVALQVGSGWQAAGFDVPILLGHTQDDQAETVLLRLSRGSGAHSLRAMDPVSGWAPGVLAVRPLLDVRRADTHAACAQWHLTPVDDPTNSVNGPWTAADGSALRRAAVRENALPALAQALGTDPVPALARTAHLLARDDDALETQAKTALNAALVQASHIKRDHLAAEGSVRNEEPVDDVPSGGENRVQASQIKWDHLPAEGPARNEEPVDDVPSGGENGVQARHVGLPQEPPQKRPQEPALELELEDIPTQPAVRDRVLRLAALRAGARAADLSSEHVRALSDLVSDWHGQGPVPLPGGVEVARHHHTLMFSFAVSKAAMNRSR